MIVRPNPDQWHVRVIQGCRQTKYDTLSSRQSCTALFTRLSAAWDNSFGTSTMPEATALPAYHSSIDSQHIDYRALGQLLCETQGPMLYSFTDVLATSQAIHNHDSQGS